MTKRHLKRINMPWFWQVERKRKTFIARPMPGPHKLAECITVDFLLREFLDCAKIKKEVKHIVHNKKVLIDKRAVKDIRFPVGLMDIVDVPGMNEYYRVMLNEEGKLKLAKIKKEDSNAKLCKIINKTALKKNKLQLNLIDGRNVIVDKDGYKVGDTVAVDLATNKIKKHLKLESGAVVLLMGGKHIGKIGVVSGIAEQSGMRKPMVTFKDKNNDSYETLKEYCYVIDKDIENEKN